MKCEECKGTGKYVGFLVEEDCQKCGGEGRIEEKSKYWVSEQIVPAWSQKSDGGWYTTFTPKGSDFTVKGPTISYSQANSPPIPSEIPGIQSNEKSHSPFSAHLVGLKVGCELSRENLYELGRRTPYHGFGSEIET